jgi:hypothetical protein
MKNIHEVMRQKELNIGRLKKEIEVLRMMVPMLRDKETLPAKTNSAPQNSGPKSGRTTEII